MRDGIRIALTTYLPDGPGRFPVVVESVPYRKDDDCYARDWQTYAYLTDRGIAGVRIDIRGTGASEGIIADEYTAAEMADTVEVIAWAASQPWSNGSVGMWGISWGGFSSLQTAMLQPEALKAIMPVHATHDRFATDVHFAGGSVMAAEQGDWPASMIGLNGLPPDPDIVGDRWREMWFERLEQTPQWPFEWFRHQHRDSYWLAGSPCADYDAIKIPTLLIGGWLDGYVDGMLAMLERLSCPRRAVIGPWGHHRPATGVPTPTYDHLDLMARWFSHHLRDDDNGVMEMPALTAWVRTTPPYDSPESSGYWAAFEQWEGAGHSAMPFPGSAVGFWRGPQWIGRHAPAWDRAVISSVDPAEDDDASLVFESAPLTEPLVLVGQPCVELTVRSDEPFGLVAVRLLVVSPEGNAYLLCRGSRNLAFPGDLSEPEPVRAAEWRSVEVPLLAASAEIPAGWKLRVAVAGADFPIVWPPARRFTLTVDPTRSRLVLPVPVASCQRIEVASLPPQPSPVEVLEATFDFSVTRQGSVTKFEKSVRHREKPPEGLVYQSAQTSSVSVDDENPATTVVTAVTSIDLRRDGWQVGTESTLDITADASAFYIKIHLTAREGEAVIFSRDWEEAIGRDWS